MEIYKLLRFVRNLVLALVLLSSAIVVSGVAVASSDKPTVSGFRVLPASLNYIGGSVTASATINNATRCIFTSSPAVAGVYKNIACSSGRVSYTAKFPENTSAKNIIYTFKLIVTGKKGEGNVTAPLKTVTVVAAPKPVINSFTTSNSELSSAGGAISLTGSVTNEVTCNISANPAIEGTSSNPVPCSTGSAIASVVMPENTSATDITYTFTLTVTGITTVTSKAITVTVDSNPPATTTTTTPPSTTSGDTVGVPAEPDAFVQSGNDIWVASCSGNAVTEINKNSKQIVDEINSPQYGFNCPDALAFDGNDIWVANWHGNSLTELNASNGAWIRTITGSDVMAPVTLAVAGSNLWVGDYPTSGAGTFFSIFNVTSGSLVQTLTQGQLGKHWSVVWPSCMVYTGTDIWVSDQGGVDVSGFNGSTGAYIGHTVNIGAGGASLSNVGCVSYHSGYLWASGSSNYDIIEYNASSGAYVRSVQHIDGPSKLIFTGTDLFVVLTTPNYSVREYNADGKFIRTIANSSYHGGQGFSSILFDGTDLWIANYPAGSVSFHPV
jgi:hypothetical protein